MVNSESTLERIHGEMLTQSYADLHRRSIMGVVAYLLIWVIVRLFTNLASVHPVLIDTVGITLLVLGVLRLGLVHQFDRWFSTHQDRMRYSFAILSVGSAATWSALVYHVVMSDGLTPSTLLLLVATAGLASGGLTTLSPSLPVSLVYLATLLMPTGIANMAQPNEEGLGLAFLFIIYWLFLSVVSKRLHNEYRTALWEHLLLDDKATELREARDQALSAVKAKNEFMATMSHELRTPLTAILGLTDLLKRQQAGPLNEKQTEYVRTIRESGLHLLTLINDILDVTNMGAGQIKIIIEPCEIEPLINDAISIIKPSADSKKLTIQVELDPRVDYLHIDKQRILQVLLNLLDNAVKFSHESGAIGLSVLGNKDTNHADIIVWDRGIGIEQEQLKRLGRPFVQADSSLARQFGGTGLGLCLSKRLAELHEGDFQLTSEPGKGTRVSVSLPWHNASGNKGGGDTISYTLTPDSPPAPIIDAVSATAESGKTAPILLVEDNRMNIMLVQSFLTTHGYQVDVANDGKEAITKAMELKPALILMDIQMPVMDGLECSRQIRALSQLKDTPIIALTALTMESDRAECLAAGINDYLAKPINPEKLLLKVQHYLQQTTARQP